MDVNCRSCHTPAVPGDRYCAACGASLPAPSRLDDGIQPLPPPVTPVRRRLEFRGSMLLLAVIGLIMFSGMAALGVAVIDRAGDPATTVSATAPDDGVAGSRPEQSIVVAELRPGGNAAYRGLDRSRPGAVSMAGGTIRDAVTMPRYAIIPGGAMASSEMTFVAGLATTPLPSVDTASVVRQHQRHPADGTGGASYHPGT